MCFLDYPSLWFRPIRYRPGGIGNWSGHIPFACDLVASLRPSVFVELGVHYGESYFAICQAVMETHTLCTAYAVDTWQGDLHTGQYGEEVFEEVQVYNQDLYSPFSHLLRTTFDEAADRFEAGSIDLLHIDGLHTYEGIRHDFETWFPKVRPGGIVLIHDIAVESPNFQAGCFWNEIRERYSTFEFDHSCGLGVVIKTGPTPLDGIASLLFRQDSATARAVRQYYELCAERLEYRRHKEKEAAGAHWEFDTQLFWRGAQSEFTETRSARTHQTVGTAECKIRLTIPPQPDPLEELRLDLSDRPVLLQLLDVSILDGGTNVVWKLKPDSPPEQLRHTGMQFLPGGSRPGALVNVTDSDPSMLIPLDDTVGAALSAGGALEIILCGVQPACRLAEIASDLQQSTDQNAYLHSVLLSREIELFEYSRSLQRASQPAPERENPLPEAARNLPSERDQQSLVHTTAVRAAQQAAVEGEKTLRVCQDALDQAQKLLAEREQQLHTYDTALGQTRKLATEREQQLRAYDAALDQAQKLVAERDQQLRAYDAALDQAQKLVAERERQLSKSSAALANAECIVSEQDGRLRQASAELEQLRVDLTRHESDKAELMRRLHDIETSLLWRLSMPFRNSRRAPGQPQPGTAARPDRRH